MILIVDICPISLYDEEGVEGWMWWLENNESFYEIGPWNEPPVMPEELFKRLSE